MLEATEAGTEAALPLLRELLVAARLWSTGSSLDLDSVAAVRTSALAVNHRRHLAGITLYADVLHEAGIDTTDEFADVRDRLFITDDWFKSYDPSWLDSNRDEDQDQNGGRGLDLDRLTAWLESVSTVRAPADREPAADLAAWRAQLRDRGVFVTFSSGTTGQPSLVPRDEATLAALRSSSGVRLPWSLPPGGYDCLLLTPAGMGSGIQSGAAGLAAGARRVHRLHSPGLREFLQDSIGGHQQVVVYGPPAGLAELLDLLDGSRVELPAGSCVVTGGGWKNHQSPTDLALLLDTASDRFGVDRRRCVDTYSTAELNTVFVSCPEGRYHVPPVVEAVVVDDLLRPRPGTGADGRLAVLDPFALSYPGLLATSDQVRLRSDPCACGLAGQTLLAPITRLPGAPSRGCGTTNANRTVAVGR